MGLIDDPRRRCMVTGVKAIHLRNLHIILILYNIVNH